MIELSATLKWGSDDVREMLDAMEATMMHKLSSSADSPLNQKIALTGETEKMPFTTNTIVTAISTYSPFGSLKSKTHNHGKYWLVNDDKEKAMRSSVNFLFELMCEFLQIFENNCENWNEIDKKEGRVLLMGNNGISALIHCMFVFLNEYTKSVDSTPSEYSDNPEELIENITHWAETLCEKIDGYTTEFITQMRAWTGKKGQGLIRTKFLSDVSKEHDDFNPPNLEDKLAMIENLWKDKADDLVDEMEKMITDNVVEVLKENFGEEPKGIFPSWFVDAVPQGVKERMMPKLVDNSTQIEASFDIVDLQKIIKNNWQDVFMPIYRVKNYPEKGVTNKDKNLKYFDKLNNLRKKVKHPVGKIIEESEFLHLSELWAKLKPQIEKYGEDSV